MVCWLTALAVGIIIFLIARFLWELIPAPGNIRDKAVLITGCDSGFGRALALKCVRNGFTVFAGCLTKQGGDGLAKEAASDRLHVVSLDVSKDESVAEAKKFVEEKLGSKKLWGIVNNAGIFSCYGPDDWVSLDAYKLGIEVNCLGVIRVTQAFKQHVKATKGRIVTVTSINGRLSSPAAGPYVVSKFGAEAYLDALRQELFHFDVKVSILEPGMFKTPLLDEKAMIDRVEGAWAKLPEDTKEEYGEKFKNYFAKAWNTTFHKMASENIYYVVDNYYHALTARFPRHRYYCGWDAKLLYVPMSLAPSWLTDAAIRGIAGQEVVPACLEEKLKKTE